MEAGLLWPVALEDEVNGIKTALLLFVLYAFGKLVGPKKLKVPEDDFVMRLFLFLSHRGKIFKRVTNN
jgi:hypothetical protein